MTVEYCYQRRQGLNVRFSTPSEAAHHMPGTWEFRLVMDAHVMRNDLQPLLAASRGVIRRLPDGRHEVTGVTQQGALAPIIDALVDLHDDEPYFADMTFRQGNRRVVFSPDEADFYVVGFAPTEFRRDSSIKER